MSGDCNVKSEASVRSVKSVCVKETVLPNTSDKSTVCDQRHLYLAKENIDHSGLDCARIGLNGSVKFKGDSSIFRNGSLKNKGGVLSPKLSTSLKTKTRLKQNSEYGFNSPKKQQTVKDMVLRLEKRISQSIINPECQISSDILGFKNVPSILKAQSQSGTESDKVPGLNTGDSKLDENRSNGASKCGLIYDQKCPNIDKGVKSRVQDLKTGYGAQVVTKFQQCSQTTKHLEGSSLRRLPSNGNVGKLAVISPKMGSSKKKLLGSSKKLKSGVRNCQSNQITRYFTPLDEPTEKVTNMVGNRTKGFGTGQLPGL